MQTEQMRNRTKAYIKGMPTRELPSLYLHVDALRTEDGAEKLVEPKYEQLHMMWIIGVGTHFVRPDI